MADMGGKANPDKFGRRKREKLCQFNSVEAFNT
jgi:hypothetical protein